MQACLNTLRAGLIASRVDVIWQMYPGVIAGPLVIGSIAGTGGRFAIDPILGGFGLLEGVQAAQMISQQSLKRLCCIQMQCCQGADMPCTALFAASCMFSVCVSCLLSDPVTA